MQSSLIHHVVDGNSFVIHEAVLENKRLYVSCGVGRVEGSNAHLTDSGRQALGALLSWLEQAPGGVGRVHFQELVTVPAASVRVRKALQAAGDKEAVFFVCRSEDIRDAALKALNPGLEPDSRP